MPPCAISNHSTRPVSRSPAPSRLDRWMFRGLVSVFKAGILLASLYHQARWDLDSTAEKQESTR